MREKNTLLTNTLLMIVLGVAGFLAHEVIGLGKSVAVINSRLVEMSNKLDKSVMRDEFDDVVKRIDGHDAEITKLKIWKAAEENKIPVKPVATP